VTTERLPEGWYYRQDGQPAGPVSAQELKDLLAAGRLRPRQPVWQHGPQGLVFVHAATAARRAGDTGDPEPASGLLPA
jgi:hypothetical protein